MLKISSLKKVSASILILASLVLSSQGFFPGVVSSSTNAIETPVALFSTSLASSITAAATAMTLVNSATLDGTTLASSTYSFIIDEGTATQEFVKADCTATACTNMDRGLSAITGTSTVTSLKFAHRRGASVKITDAPLLLNLTRILAGIGFLPAIVSYNPTTSTSTLAGSNIPSVAYVLSQTNIASTSALAYVLGASNSWASTNKFLQGLISSASSTFVSTVNVPYSTASSSAASVGFANALAFAGVSNADDTTKGIVETATAAEAALGTINGGTGARLVLGANLATSTSQVAQNSVVVSNTSGKLDPSFLTGTASYVLTNLSVTNSTSSATSTAVIGSFPAYQIGKNVQVFTSTGTSTFAIPSGISKIYVRVQGAGAGGGGASNACSPGCSGGGGGGGGYSEGFIDVSATTSVQVFVGTGGTPGNNSGTSGVSGTWSTFGTNGFYSSGAGGVGGTGSVSNSGVANSGAGGTSAGGDIQIHGASGHSFINTRGGIAGGSAMSPAGSDSYGAGGDGGANAGGNSGANGLVEITW